MGNTPPSSPRISSSSSGPIKLSKPIESTKTLQPLAPHVYTNAEIMSLFGLTTLGVPDKRKTLIVDYLKDSAATLLRIALTESCDELSGVLISQFNMDTEKAQEIAQKLINTYNTLPVKIEQSDNSTNTSHIKPEEEESNLATRKDLRDLEDKLFQHIFEKRDRIRRKILILRDIMEGRDPHIIYTSDKDVIQESQQNEKKTEKDEIEQTKEIKTETKEEKIKKVPKPKKGKSKKTKPKKDEEAEIEQSDNSKSESESDSLDEEGSDSSDSDSDIDSDDSSEGSEKKKGKKVKARFLQPTGRDFHIQIQGPIATWASSSNEGVTLLVDKVITKGLWKITFTFQNSDCQSYVTGIGFVESPYTFDQSEILGENTKGCKFSVDGSIEHQKADGPNIDRNSDSIGRCNDGGQMSVEVDMRKKTARFFIGEKQAHSFVAMIPSRIQFAARAYHTGTIFRIVSLLKLRKPTATPIKGEKRLVW